MRPKLVLTVDTEALPARAAEKHVSKLILGDAPDHQLGILRMFDICADADVRMTFFLDIAEIALYGDEVLDVGRRIVDAGHDLQMHMHPTLLGDEWWAEFGYKRPSTEQDRYDEVAAEFAIGTLLDQLNAIRPNPVTGYRGGAFRYNANILNALAKRGIKTVWNNNAAASIRDVVRTNYVPHNTFAWDNGLIEISASEIGTDDHPSFFEFPFPSITKVKIEEYVNRLASVAKVDEIYCCVLHSWSLMVKNRETGFFEPSAPGRANKFAQFLEVCKKHFDIIVAADVPSVLDKRRLPVVPLENALVEQVRLKPLS